MNPEGPDNDRLLVNHITRRVAEGMRIAFQGDDHVVLTKGQRPNHLLHFFISLFTIGFWTFIWIALTVLGGEKRRIAYVEGGRVREKRVWTGGEKFALAAGVIVILILIIVLATQG